MVFSQAFPVLLLPKGKQVVEFLVLSIRTVKLQHPQTRATSSAAAHTHWQCFQSQPALQRTGKGDVWRWDGEAFPILTVAKGSSSPRESGNLEFWCRQTSILREMAVSFPIQAQMVTR